jgi:nitrous oxide reductase accessory protein NosL
VSQPASPPLRRHGLRAAALLLIGGTLALAQEDVGAFRECQYCGMDRKAYGFSRMVVRYQDGSSAGVCSLHCAVTEMAANPGKPVRQLQVADRDTRELVDAEGATWVLGGRKRGVMTMRAKWAFATRAAAEAFLREQGGELVPWEKALEAAREDVALEEAQARAARQRRGLGCSGPPARPPS